MHNGLLTMTSGQKMGKSLGNVINVNEATAQFPAQTLRLYYLQNHYRSPLPWDEDALPSALAMLSRLYEAKETAEAMGGEEDADKVATDLGDDAREVLALGRGFADKLYAAMDEDMNTARALGDLFELARAINRFSNHKKAKKRGGPVVAPALKAFALVGDALGLMTQETAAFFDEVKVKRLAALGVTVEEIEAALAARQQARADKNWAEADKVRADLEAKQIVVMDRPDGVDWRVRVV
jgi:cysteinyl-tRNA synthetase